MVFLLFLYVCAVHSSQLYSWDDNKRRFVKAVVIECFKAACVIGRAFPPWMRQVIIATRGLWVPVEFVQASSQSYSQGITKSQCVAPSSGEAWQQEGGQHSDMWK